MKYFQFDKIIKPQGQNFLFSILGEVKPLEEKLKDDAGVVQLDNIDNDKDAKMKRLEEKDKRKKFVRLLCPHCRVECATFRVN